MMKTNSPRMLSLAAAVLFGLGSYACGDGNEDGGSSSGGSGSGSATPTSSNPASSQGSTSADEGGSGTGSAGSQGSESTPSTSASSTPTSGENTSGKESSEGENTSSTTTSGNTSSGETTSEPEPEPQKITLEVHIQPIFNESCGCHVSNNAGGLTLKSGEAYAALLNKTGTKVGTLLTPNDPSKSAVYGVTAHTEQPVMPKGKSKLPADKIKLMEDWIKGGALEK